jgi:hypothetical protein
MVPYSVMMIRRTIAIVALGGLAACGGGNPAPIPSLTTKAPPPTSEVWSISGRVTAFGTNTPVSGAHVTASAGATPADTDADGRYKLAYGSAPGSSVHAVITAQGYLQREFYVQYQPSARSGIDATLIREAAPFSLTFYRQLLRNSYEGPSGTYEVSRRLQDSPRLYIRTIDQSGNAIEPEVLDLVRTNLTRAVGEWSNGALSVTTLETGTDTRPRSDGWIVVNIIHDSKAQFCGQAYIGVTDGQIEFVDDNCSCGNIKIPAAVVVHEVGHALGFWHVSDRNSVMYPTDSGSCAPGQLSDAERYHASVAYSRPRLNADPDADDPQTAFVQSGPRPPDVLVVN